MSDSSVDKKSQLMTAINSRNIEKVTKLCVQNVLDTMNVLDLNDILLSALPTSLNDKKYPIFLHLMRQKGKIQASVEVAFFTAHQRFVRKLLEYKRVEDAKQWCDIIAEDYNKPFTDEQMLRVLGDFFDITNKNEARQASLDFNSAFDVALVFFMSQYDKSDVDAMFNVFVVQSLKEYKLSYVEYMLENGVVFDVDNKHSHLAFYDNNFRRINKHNGEAVVTAKPLSGWLSYLTKRPIEHADMLSFGYNVYFAGKDDCESPADVLNKAPEWQRQYILPFLGAL